MLGRDSDGLADVGSSHGWASSEENVAPQAASSAWGVSATQETTTAQEASGTSATAASASADEAGAPQVPTLHASDGHGPEADDDAPPLRAPQWLEACDGTGLRPGGRDFYEHLGVEQSIGPEDLRRSYREQARRLHPDKAGPEATEQFQLLSQAYGALSHKDLRSMYDLLLERFPPARPTAAELCPGITSTGRHVDDPFRASISELRAVATFNLEGRLQVPTDLRDTSWQRCSHDIERVRLTFCGCYSTLSGDGLSSLRLRVYDSVMLHLAALLVAGGWRSEVGEEGEDTEETHHCRHSSQLVARHFVLGSVDALSPQGGPDANNPLMIRFALEGCPRELRAFLQLSCEQALRRTGQDCAIS